MLVFSLAKETVAFLIFGTCYFFGFAIYSFYSVGKPNKICQVSYEHMYHRSNYANRIHVFFFNIHTSWCFCSSDKNSYTDIQSFKIVVFLDFDPSRQLETNEIQYGNCNKQRSYFYDNTNFTVHALMFQPVGDGSTCIAIYTKCSGRIKVIRRRT